MFIIEYRTISRIRPDVVHQSHVATLGLHKASSCEEAAAYILRTTQNVEILGVQYRAHGV